MTIPTLNFLKKNFPAGSIDVFAPANVLPLFAEFVKSFHVHAFDPQSLLTRYDFFFINTVGVFRLSYEALARATSRYAAGFRYPDERPNDRLYDFSLVISETQHDIDQNLSLASQTLGLAFKENDRYYPDAPAVRSGDTSLHCSVLLHPGAGKDYGHKKWPFERYVAIIKRLLERECRVTVLLGPDEVDDYTLFSKIRGITICHSHTPVSLVATVKAADLFIGNDSGPAHCASLYGIPTVTLFGPANPLRNAPRGKRCVAIANAFPCAPCHFKSAPCEDNRCVQSITVDQVWKAVEEILKMRRP